MMIKIILDLNKFKISSHKSMIDYNFLNNSKNISQFTRKNAAKKKDKKIATKNLFFLITQKFLFDKAIKKHFKYSKRQDQKYSLHKKNHG